MNITFIGGGNMAAALIGGLLSQGVEAGAVRVIDPAGTARERLARDYGVRCEAALPAESVGNDIVVLAVKPQQMRVVCAELAGRLTGQLVLSIAAGIRLGDLSRWLGGYQQLARCMPNTPALIGCGITGVYAADAVSATQRQQAQRILEAAGRVVWVKEECELDAVTAVSGSGPAYVFYFIEAIQRAAVEAGLAPDAARELVLETFRGATALAMRSEESVDVLRARVTSKGGTTERALAALEQHRVGEAVRAAVEAARARAAELGVELGKDQPL